MKKCKNKKFINDLIVAFFLLINNNSEKLHQ